MKYIFILSVIGVHYKEALTRPRFVTHSPRHCFKFFFDHPQNYRIEYPSAFLLEVASSMTEVLQGPPELFDGRGKGRVRCISTPLENEVMVRSFFFSLFRVFLVVAFFGLGKLCWLRASVTTVSWFQR